MLADEVFIDGRRFFTGPENPGVPHTRKAVADPERNARVSAAIDLAFARVDPRAVFDAPVTGGSGKEVLFDSEGVSPHGWLLYHAARPDWPGPFRRADYRQTADAVCASLIAREDGVTVTYDDDLGYGSMEEMAASLARFAAKVTR